jgi:hypothetical protein
MRHSSLDQQKMYMNILEMAFSYIFRGPVDFCVKINVKICPPRGKINISGRRKYLVKKS